MSEDETVRFAGTWADPIESAQVTSVIFAVVIGASYLPEPSSRM